MTWGFDVAQTEFYPPHIYLAIFLIALPGQFLFGVTPMTMAAVTTTFVFSAIYHAATGSFFFVDSHVPIAVFLGMNLLFTDPATSPRTLPGRIFLRRALRAHGRSPVRVAAEREHAGLLRQAAPGAVPQPVREVAGPVGELAHAQGHRSVGVAPAWTPRRRHLAYMGVWGLAFGAMSASGKLGDEHPGQWTPFWDQACAADRREACLNLFFLQDGFCTDGSPWACNEVRHPAGRALRQSQPRRIGVRTGVHAAISPPVATTPPRSRRAACSAMTLRPTWTTSSSCAAVRVRCGISSPPSCTRARASSSGRAPAGVVDLQQMKSWADPCPPSAWWRPALLRRHRLSRGRSPVLLHRQTRLAMGTIRKPRAIDTRLRTGSAVGSNGAPHHVLLRAGSAGAVQQQAAARRCAGLHGAVLLGRSACPGCGVRRPMARLRARRSRRLDRRSGRAAGRLDARARCADGATRDFASLAACSLCRDRAPRRTCRPRRCPR